ncbi:TPA: hypothetical protein J1Z77_004400 [Escherichia coli]|nr:hypothetical protein [Escherichia coli]HBA7894281.1 hypothetical protein [Escherichia coli]HBA7908980.1 hypothetical protein [Escherichia coli]
MLNKKLNMRVLRHSLMIASATSVLTGCDYFTDNWEIRNGACQAISSEGNETALISDEGMVFMSMDKGCPDNLDFPGTRFITTRINDQTWKSLMICNSATGFRRMVTLGDTPRAAPDMAARAIPAFTHFMGATVTIEGKTATFRKGNFTEACKTFIPKSLSHTDTRKNKKMTLDEFLYSGDRQPHSPETEITSLQERMMTESGYEKVNGEWRKKSRMPTGGYTNEQAGYSSTTKRFNNADNNPPDTHIQTPAYDATVTSPGKTDTGSGGQNPPEPEKARPAAPDSQSAIPATALADCTLTNGKALSALAQDGFPYTYHLLKKDGTLELELKEGMFGVSAFHYWRDLNRGKGKLKYLRFHKGLYDYVVVQRYDGETPAFDGILVFNQGTRIATLNCRNTFSELFTIEQFPDNSHKDNEDMADFIEGYTVRGEAVC